MKKKIKIRKAIRVWKQLPLEVTYDQVLKWIKTAKK
jgi:hypothetical protein